MPGNRIILAAALLLAATPPASAKQFFKCTGADGRTSYSDTPCPSAADKVETMEARHAPAATAPPDAFTAINRNNALLGTARTEAACIATARAAAYDHAAKREAEYRGRIHELERRIARANNNLAGATLETGLRQEIGALQTSIAQERAAADGLFATARTRCEEDRRQAEAALDSATPPSE